MALPATTGTRRSLMVIAAVTFAAACSEPERTTSPSQQNLSTQAPRYTAGVGFTGSLLGRASSPDGFKLKRKNGSWEFDMNAKDPVDVAVQSLTLQPGGSSGWHSHPGPVILQVISGTLTFYEAGDPSCTPTVRTAGQLFVESGENPHITRNEGGVVATAIATVFAPSGAPLRIDEPAPGNCPF